MIRDGKALCLGDVVLPFFDVCVKKLLYPSAIQAHQMVMVLAVVEFIDRLAAFEVAAVEDAGLFKLGENPIHRGQPHVRPVLKKDPENVFSGHMALRACLKDLQDFQPRQCGFQAGIFEFFDVGHAVFLALGRQAALAAQPLQ